MGKKFFFTPQTEVKKEKCINDPADRNDNSNISKRPFNKGNIEFLTNKVHCETIRKSYKFLNETPKGKSKKCIPNLDKNKNVLEHKINMLGSSALSQPSFRFEDHGLYFDEDLDINRLGNKNESNFSSNKSNLDAFLVSIKNKKTKEKRVKSSRLPMITYWKLMVAFLLTYKIILLSCLVIPFVIMSKNILTEVGNEFQIGFDQTSQQSMKTIQDFNDAFFEFAGAEAFQCFLENIFTQPQHASNSILNSMMFVSKYLDSISKNEPKLGIRSPMEIGKYLGKLPENGSNFTLDLDEWKQSALTSIFDVISTGFYNETTFGAAIFEDQILFVNLVRDSKNMSVIRAENYFYFDNDDQNQSYVFNLNGSTTNEYSSKKPWEPGSTVSHTYKYHDYATLIEILKKPLRKQQNLAKIYSNTNTLFGHWATQLVANSMLYRNLSTGEIYTKKGSEWGFSYFYPWAPCGNYSCLSGAIGGATTFSDISKISNKHIMKIVGLLEPIKTLIDTNLIKFDLDNNTLRQLALNRENIKTPDQINTIGAQLGLNMDKFSLNNVEQLMQFTFSYLVESNNGSLVGISRGCNDIVENSLGKGLWQKDFQYKAPPSPKDINDKKINKLAKYIEDVYGPISQHNSNYSTLNNIYVDISDFIYLKEKPILRECLDPYYSRLDSHHTEHRDSGLCALISIVPLVSGGNITLYPSIETKKMVLFFCVPLAFMSNALRVNMTKQVNLSMGYVDESSKKFNSIIIIEIGIACAWTIIGLISVLLIITKLAQTIENLSKDMVRMINMDYRHNIKTFSNISEIKTMQEAILALNHTLKKMILYIPKAIIHQMIDEGREANLDEQPTTLIKMDIKIVTVFFSDLANFTTISEALQPTELLNFITRYLTLMTHAIEEFDGTVCEIQGDGILAFWNTPNNIEQHELKACASALEQIRFINILNKEFKWLLKKYNLPPFEMRIGIHTGKAMTGSLGSVSKLKFGCIGDTVNQGSRLEGLCKLYGTSCIVSQDTFQNIPDGYLISRKLDHVRLKGKTLPTTLYEVIAIRKPFYATKKGSLKNLSNLSEVANIEVKLAFLASPEYINQQDQIMEQQMRNIELYEEALEFYKTGQFVKALKQISKIKNHDQAVIFLQNRINVQLQQNDSESFDPILNLEKKSF